MRPEKAEVAGVLRVLGEDVEKIGLNTHQLRHLSAIGKCRTAELGGHVDKCSDCGSIHISYNSCRNRHCPKCQGHKREEWMQARIGELLPVPYFHVVFTLPDKLSVLAMRHPQTVYGLLFASAWETLQTFFNRQGVKGGMISILHTWGQNLSLHPHLHCIVPGGGVDKNGQWKNIRSDGKYLFPVKGLSKMFRAKYVEKLRGEKIALHSFTQTLFETDWVVYAKRPFGSTHSIIEYLGRYTHKVAISNHRIKAVDRLKVAFEYKDYRKNGRKGVMSLSNQEFIRRFALHILPAGFVRIRHYGILSGTWKRVRLPALQRQLGVKLQSPNPQKGTLLHRCPHCKTGTLVTIMTFSGRDPPECSLRGFLSASC
jgi:predicted Zn-ribbon and HTH transcriptional regulator